MTLHTLATLSLTAPAESKNEECLSLCSDAAWDSDRPEMLAYVQVDRGKDECSCLIHAPAFDENGVPLSVAPSSEPPDDLQAADFFGKHTRLDTSGNVDLFLVSTMHWPGTLPQTLDGIDGRGVSYMLDPWDGKTFATPSFATLTMTASTSDAQDVCIADCAAHATANGHSVFHGTIQGSTCKCATGVGAHANVQDGTSQAFVGTICAHSVPDTTESRYVWSRDAPTRWCAGGISQLGAGNRLLTSTLLPTLIDPSDRAQTCQSLCETADDCQVAELHTVSWNDVSGAVIANPPSPPPPPAPPPPPPPSVFPSPPPPSPSPLAPSPAVDWYNSCPQWSGGTNGAPADAKTKVARCDVTYSTVEPGEVCGQTKKDVSTESVCEQACASQNLVMEIVSTGPASSTGICYMGPMPTDLVTARECKFDDSTTDCSSTSGDEDRTCFCQADSAPDEFIPCESTFVLHEQNGIFLIHECKLFDLSDSVQICLEDQVARMVIAHPPLRLRQRLPAPKYQRVSCLDPERPDDGQRKPLARRRRLHCDLRRLRCGVWQRSRGGAVAHPNGVREALRNLRTTLRVCPYECTPRKTSHSLVGAAERALYGGQGLGGLLLGGLAGVDAVGGADANRILQEPNYLLDGITKSACDAIGADRRLLGGMLTVWIAHERLGVGGILPGTCATYFATRTSTQRTLWQAFEAHAQRTTSLPHFATPFDISVATSVPNDAIDCFDSTATCITWYEFDDETYSCDPMVRLSGAHGFHFTVHEVWQRDGPTVFVAD